ncbi:MAG: DNA-protecting protein DprA [Desulfobacterales bacterium]|nr:DNA-protecting protein DprA [Desulfobacterales bacterium]
MSRSLEANEKKDWLSLSLIPGLGPVTFWNLINNLGSPTEVLDASATVLLQMPGVKPSLVEALAQKSLIDEVAEAEMIRLHELDAHLITAHDSAYPELLRRTVAPPPVLFVRGRKDLLNRPSVAIVGSRAATSYGRRTAFNLASNLAAKQVIVVSGLATGIDAEAHAGCLAGGGDTIAVLGCGLDIVYPRSNQDLYHQVIEQGVLVSEYALGTKPDGFRFPARNRIIAGLSHGVVVVEAARKSGSLITVQYALEEGREVFAVPGQIDSAKSSGSHWLLQQGATLIVSADDIIDNLPLHLGEFQHQDAPTRSQPAELDDDSLALLKLLDSYPIRRDELLERSGMKSAKISEMLLLLELEGLIELLPGDELRRV